MNNKHPFFDNLPDVESPEKNPLHLLEEHKEQSSSDETSEEEEELKKEETPKKSKAFSHFNRPLSETYRRKRQRLIIYS